MSRMWGWLGAGVVALLGLLGGIGATMAGEVPFVPTPQVVVDEIMRLAKVGAQDVVYDLGSGDGRIVITAAQQFGARGVGVELDRELVLQSEEDAPDALHACVSLFSGI